MATVIHSEVSVGDRVRIHRQVTVGCKDTHPPHAQAELKGLRIEDDVVLFRGCNTLGGAGVTTLGRGLECICEHIKGGPAVMRGAALRSATPTAASLGRTRDGTGDVVSQSGTGASLPAA